MPDKGAVQVTGKPLPVGGGLKNRVFDLINEFPGVQRKILVEKLGEGFAQPLGYLFL